MREISDYTQALINDIKHRMVNLDMIMLQDTAVRNVENFYWKSMEKSLENVWYVRTVPADIKRRFQGSQMPDVPYAIRRWKWSEKVKDRSLYVFMGIKKNQIQTT